MTDETSRAWVWVFFGAGARFASGVFDTRDKAEDWIRRHGLHGTLTRYPMNTGVYDWAIEQGHFAPSKPHHTSREFIQGFTSATQEHQHYGADEEQDAP